MGAAARVQVPLANPTFVPSRNDNQTNPGGDGPGSSSPILFQSRDRASERPRLQNGRCAARYRGGTPISRGSDVQQQHGGLPNRASGCNSRLPHSFAVVISKSVFSIQSVPQVPRPTDSLNTGH